jgi:hypothetical protein
MSKQSENQTGPGIQSREAVLKPEIFLIEALHRCTLVGRISARQDGIVSTANDGNRLAEALIEKKQFGYCRQAVSLPIQVVFRSWR